MKTIEIMFDDLTSEKKLELLRAYAINSKFDMNWDIIPISIIDVEEDDTCPNCGEERKVADQIINNLGEEYCPKCEPDMIGVF